MRVVALLGSRRTLGNSDVLLQEACRGAAGEGAEVEVFRSAELEVRNCRGCLSCVFRGKCATEDDVPRLLESLLAADGLLVAAPTYLLTPAGVIKQIGDRGLNLSPHLEELRGRRRVAATISVAGNELWNPLGVELLNQFALIFGFQVVDFMEAYAPGPAEVLLDARNAAAARALGERLVRVWRGEEERRTPGPAQCPVCYSRSWRLESEGRVLCPICLTEGRAVEGEQWRVEFDPSAEEKNFWSLVHREEHVENWIKPSQPRYLANRPRLKDLLAGYRRPEQA